MNISSNSAIARTPSRITHLPRGMAKFYIGLAIIGIVLHSIDGNGQNLKTDVTSAEMKHGIGEKQTCPENKPRVTIGERNMTPESGLSTDTTDTRSRMPARVEHKPQVAAVHSESKSSSEQKKLPSKIPETITIGREVLTRVETNSPKQTPGKTEAKTGVDTDSPKQTPWKHEAKHGVDTDSPKQTPWKNEAKTRVETHPPKQTPRKTEAKTRVDTNSPKHNPRKAEVMTRIHTNSPKENPQKILAKFGNTKQLSLGPNAFLHPRGSISKSQKQRNGNHFPVHSQVKKKNDRDGHHAKSDTTGKKRVKSAGRIINGTRSEHIPFLVSVQAFNKSGDSWTHGCGGSIVTPTVVLTACHCIGLVDRERITFANHRLMRVVAGTDNIRRLSPTAQIREVSQLIPHPRASNYPETDDGWFLNDVGVMVVKTPFVFNAAVRPMRLYSNDKQRSAIKMRQMVDQGQTCIVPGWGSTQEFEVKHPDTLMVSVVKLIPDDSCRQIFCEHTARHCTSNFASMGQVCSVSKASSDCRGDSGGPVVCNGQVFGIVSYGERCIPGWPSVFQSIRPIMEVIKDHIHDGRKRSFEG